MRIFSRRSANDCFACCGNAQGRANLSPVEQSSGAIRLLHGFNPTVLRLLHHYLWTGSGASDYIDNFRQTRAWQRRSIWLILQFEGILALNFMASCSIRSKSCRLLQTLQAFSSVGKADTSRRPWKKNGQKCIGWKMTFYQGGCSLAQYRKAKQVRHYGKVCWLAASTCPMPILTSALASNWLLYHF